MRTVKTLIRLGGGPGWSMLGAHAILLVLSWDGWFTFSNIFCSRAAGHTKPNFMNNPYGPGFKWSCSNDQDGCHAHIWVKTLRYVLIFFSESNRRFFSSVYRIWTQTLHTLLKWLSWVDRDFTAWLNLFFNAFVGEKKFNTRFYGNYWMLVHLEIVDYLSTWIHMRTKGQGHC